MIKTIIMDIKISGPKTIEVNAGLPASKSISNRMLVIRELSGGTINVKNLSDCDDTFVMERALKTIHEATPIYKVVAPATNESTTINKAAPPVTIDIMAAGTSMRFLTALLSTMPTDVTITGTERMLHRPIGILVDALRCLGANIDYVGEEGFPPLRIKGGTLRGGAIEMRGDVSSQYISAVMMIAPVMRDGLTLKITGTLASRPYMEMTAGLMRMFGAEVVEKQGADGLYIIIKAGRYGANVGEHHTNRISDKPVNTADKPINEEEQNNGIEYSVESDWSAASYWYEMLSLAQNGSVRLKGLSNPSLQGDAVVSRLFEPLGIKTEFRHNEALLTKTERTIDYYEADLNTCPDLAQTMVATCCAMGVRFRFDGLQSLRIKETDRLTALRQELGKLGFVINETDGRVLYWDGERKTAASPTQNAVSAAQNAASPVQIATYKDHRMAMCLAPLSMTGAELIIQDAGVVSKSYPTFWTELENAGFEMETVKSQAEK